MTVVESNVHIHVYTDQCVVGDSDKRAAGAAAEGGTAQTPS